MAAFLRSARYLRNMCDSSQNFSIVFPILRFEKRLLQPCQTLADQLKPWVFCNYMNFVGRVSRLMTYRKLDNKPKTIFYSSGFATKPTGTIVADLQQFNNKMDCYGRISSRDFNELLRKVKNEWKGLNSEQCLMIINFSGIWPWFIYISLNERAWFIGPFYIFFKLWIVGKVELNEEIPDVGMKLVQDFLKTVVKQKIKLDISHYNALLRVYVENKHTFSPIDFLANLKAKDLNPNRYDMIWAR